VPFKFTGKLAKVVIDLMPTPLGAADERKLKQGQAAIRVAR